jgi:two-component system, cell cycle sensor histidine kinase and response regulator CckA
VLAHAFEPFFTTKPEGKGTGLGLSMVYGIVTQAGGHATIRSQLGLGTTVTVYLPIATDGVEQRAEPALPAIAGADTQTILLVEDEDGLRQVMERILTRRGYTVISASTAAQALDQAKRFPGTIDLLLTDVVMPITSGPDLAQRILELRPSMQVLFMSGYANAGAGVCAARRFLAKPFTPPVLLQAVRECLNPPALNFSHGAENSPPSWSMSAKIGQNSRASSGIAAALG